MYKSIKLSKNNQIALPKEFRELYGMKAGDNVGVRNVEDGILIMPEKKVTTNDIIGLIKEDIPYNAVEIKKRGAKGHKW